MRNLAGHSPENPAETACSFFAKLLIYKSIIWMQVAGKKLQPAIRPVAFSIERNFLLQLFWEELVSDLNSKATNRALAGITGL
ncbi:MAG TPA: hypothetical protein VFA90_12255 [Terriglobales bacterium]|nr:hypothetical protein [Terriglobales bacterium]